MRSYLVIVVALGFFLSGPQAVISADGDGLEGTWSFVSAEAQGKKFSMKELADDRIVFTDKTMAAVTGGKVVNFFNYKVDAQTDPQSIDFDGIEGQDKGKTQLGIFEVNAQEMKLCVSVGGKDRPAAFRTEEGKDWTLLVLKREPLGSR